jgi:hypothetical protein
MAFLLPSHLSRGRQLNSLEGGGGVGFVVDKDEVHSAGPTKSISFSSSSDDDDSDQDSYDGSHDGQHSVLSGATNDTSFSGIVDEYTEGDLQTLNQLVNKLHAAELQREAKKQQANHRHRVDDEPTKPSCSTPIDFPSELPENPPPHFSPLQSSHHLSVSAVDSWQGSSIEIVPTENVATIMPQWNNEWSRDRLEWEEQRRKSLVVIDDDMTEIKRSRTLNDAGAPGGDILLKRNNSLPDSLRKHHHSEDSRGQNHNLHHSSPPTNSPTSITKTSITTATSHSRNYKYGKPPTLPNADNPNPMVSRSSKRINKKHAQYALCAGMMLGIRESVGGAKGVEAELQISMWEGCERTWLSQVEDGTSDNNEEKEAQLDESVTDDKSITADDANNHSQSAGSNLSSSPARRSNSYASISTSSSPARQNSTTATAEAYTTLTTECERVAKYKLPANQFYLGSNTSKPLPHKYKFKVYAPLVFARIRSLFGVEKQTFLHSICGKFNFYEFASNARSGQVR